MSERRTNFSPGIEKIVERVASDGEARLLEAAWLPLVWCEFMLIRWLTDLFHFIFTRKFCIRGLDLYGPTHLNILDFIFAKNRALVGTLLRGFGAIYADLC